MRRQLFPAFMMMVVFTVITGLAFPLVVTGIAQGVFNDKADGSQVENADGEVVGSSLHRAVVQRAGVLPPQAVGGG